jgi:hypothetical protein
MTVRNDVHLWILFINVYKRAISIPIGRHRTYSLYPLEWLLPWIRNIWLGRILLHLDLSLYFVLIAPHNFDAQQPSGDANLKKWPPAYIFDFYYGCAALKAWSADHFAQIVQ